MLQFLLSDNESLLQYLNEEYVSIEEIKMRLFLKKRAQNFLLPDHLYRLEQTIVFDTTKSLSVLFTATMPDFVSSYLELENNRIYIRQEKHNDWQEILTFIPPLWLQSLLLFKKTNDKFSLEDRVKYFNTYIVPNTQYTSIPSAKIPHLNYFIAENKGLHDLHMHLNGALETDQVWQDYLFNPKEVYYHLKKGYKSTKVKEQLEQESVQFTPLNYYKLLKIAQRLRELFYVFLFPDEAAIYKEKNKMVLLQKLVNDFSSYPGNYQHPFRALVCTSIQRHPNEMSIEALMHIMILDRLQNNPNEILAGLLHFYLLILGLTNRLLVQQTHQNGFEQFQKHTLNELREGSEKEYMRRYHQMHGNNMSNLHFLEGRFSPKATQQDMISFISKIYKGWNKLLKDIYDKNNNSPIPQLCLIAHFIKRPEKRIDKTIRHKELRYDLIKRGKVLAYLLKNHSQYRRKITGIDAASSEFDAPPEVFAPLFRMMRRAGIQHFTYHAGEDFYHVLDGLRAIYEAIHFCDLRTGDRIGHATASGLSVHLWSKVIGNSLRIKKGDHMDNLIFCYHLIMKYRIIPLQGTIPYISNEVSNLCFTLYNEYFSMEVLERAWLMRQCCPVHTLESNKENIRSVSVFDNNEWNFVVEKNWIKERKLLTDNPAWRAFEAYHRKQNREKFNEIITIDPFEILKKEQVEQIQLTLLQLMSEKEIVIETLPTSNVRIGFHKDFDTYHLANWIRWKKEGKNIPAIVVGTDDTGIFSTNIYNEYANIYSSFINTHNTPHSETMAIIKQLDESSKIYRFEFTD